MYCCSRNPRILQMWSWRLGLIYVLELIIAKHDCEGVFIIPWVKKDLYGQTESLFTVSHWTFTTFVDRESETGELPRPVFILGATHEYGRRFDFRLLPAPFRLLRSRRRDLGACSASVPCPASLPCSGPPLAEARCAGAVRCCCRNLKGANGYAPLHCKFATWWLDWSVGES